MKKNLIISMIIAAALFAGCVSATAQVTMTVQPDESGVMKFYASAQQLVVNWGDGQTETFTNVTNSGISHTYAARTTYTVRISETQLTKLDVSGCTALQVLACSDNQLASLNVSGCTALQYLYCSGNQLTSLDVSSCTALQRLECYNNPLTSLDASGCTALKYLYCHDNQLTSLDVSSCTALHRLVCHNNQLTASALNAIFTALPDRTGDEDSGIVRVLNNPGSEDCDKSIAENKNWYIEYILIAPL
jgi:Leucine-rich repeat (LRR) protein